jgi:hypothetical protein
MQMFEGGRESVNAAMERIRRDPRHRNQSLVEFEQRGRLAEHSPVPNPARIQERGSQPEDQAVEGGQIRRPMSGTIADQQLMFEQQQFCGGGAGAPWAQQLREGGE